MNDPRRPYGSDPNQPGWSPPTEPLGDRNPPYTDPAYAGQFSYPSYNPPPDATRELPPYWTQTQYQSPGGPPPPAPPEPPRSPRWLWFLAGGAVLLVIGLVVAMVIADGSSERDTAVTPLPPMPEPTGITPPTTTRTPSTTTRPAFPPTAPSESPTTSPSAPSGATETVTYSVTGEGRAISITYVDSGAMMQMEFNVALPWSKQVTLESPASSTASVTVFNVGRDVTCSVTVDGEPVQQRTGSGITMCAGVR